MAGRLRHELHYRSRLVRCYAERPAGIDALFRAGTARAPDAHALVLGETRVSYRALDGIVDRLAANLAAAGLAPGERLALLVGNRLEFVYAVLAAARLGAIVVPMNPRQKAPETAFILNQCGARILIFEAALATELPAADATPALERRYAVGGGAEAVLFESLLAPAPPPPAPNVPEEAVAAILYTSGTTGRPKGAMLTHLGIVHSVLHFEECMALRPGDRTILAVPASHVTGLVAVILTMLRVGGCTVMMPAFKGRDYLALAERERVSMTVLVPAMYNLCLLEPDFDSFDLSSWRIGGYGGAPMPEATIARLAEKLPGLVLVNAYGATETTSPTTIMPLGATAGHADSVGKVVPCGEVRVMDEQGREVAPGESGELWVAGPMVVPGYWDNPAATADAFAGGWWKSGDIGSVDAEGYVRVFDRKKDMINRAGYKVYSAEVENVLSHHPAVVECAAVAHPDPVLGEKVHVFVLPRGAVGVDELRRFCAERLSDYKVPDYVTFVAAPLPRNANGKLLKTALRDRL
jgi:acyl-CoA synthetase (AMP-forming)/AMP-acid ligase II